MKVKTRKEVIKMPVKWTRPKNAADDKPKKAADSKRTTTSKPKGGKPKGKPANAKAAADKKEAK
jgi:hypothetical protein